MVAGVIDGRVASEFVFVVSCCELRCENESISVVSLLHPFAKPLLRLLVLVVIGYDRETITLANAWGLEASSPGSVIVIRTGINEVPSSIIVCVHELERLFLVHRSHEASPSISNRHCPQTQRRDTNACRGREYFVSTKLGLRGWCWLEHLLHGDCCLLRIVFEI